MADDQFLNITELEKYHFFQLVEVIYRIKGQNIDNLLKQDPYADIIDFIGNNSLAFAPRDISAVKIRNNRFEIKVPFFNLIGTHSPLPNYYLDEIAQEQELSHTTVMLNLFNHRLITFLYKVWRKYRYFICFKSNGADEFSKCMFSLIGLGSCDARNLLQVNPSKMLSYIGILTNSSRSPQLLVTLISHCFELSSVEISSWQFRRVAIAEQQLNKLGQNNCNLSKNFILGSHMVDYRGKFMLIIRELTLKKMQNFLPNGSLYNSLVNFVLFVMREQLAWDLCLVLAPNQVNRIRIGLDNGCYLGWTTFLGTPPLKPQTIITVST